MSRSLSLLAKLIVTHQQQEVELRRCQNVVASENVRGYIAVVDTTWSDEAEPDDDIASRTPHSGVVPVSDVTWSNWHMGNDHPFVVLPEHNPALSPQENEIIYPWIKFRITSERGVLCMIPGGERVFVEWGQEGVSQDCCFRFQAFETLEAATSWASVTATALTSRATHSDIPF